MFPSLITTEVATEKVGDRDCLETRCAHVPDLWRVSGKRHLVLFDSFGKGTKKQRRKRLCGGRPAVDTPGFSAAGVLPCVL